MAAAAVPLAVAQLGHIGGSVNNDNLLVLLFALLTVVLVHVAGGDTTRRTGLVVGATAAAALLTKGFALAALPWVAAAYLLAWRRRDWGAARLGALAAGLATCAGLWWYVLNLYRYGTLQPEELTKEVHPRVRFEPDVADFATRFADDVSTSFWGRFGYLEVPLPGSVAHSATVLLLVLCCVGVIRAGNRLLRAALLLPVGGILAIQVVGTYRLYDAYGVLAGHQGRYLFPALPALAVLAAGGLSALVGRLAAVVAVAAAICSHAFGLLTYVRGTWQPLTGDLFDAALAISAWIWWPTPLLVAALSCALGVAAAAVLWARPSKLEAGPAAEMLSRGG